MSMRLRDGKASRSRRVRAGQPRPANIPDSPAGYVPPAPPPQPAPQPPLAFQPPVQPLTPAIVRRRAPAPRASPSPGPPVPPTPAPVPEETCPGPTPCPGNRLSNFLPSYRTPAPARRGPLPMQLETPAYARTAAPLPTSIPPCPEKSIPETVPDTGESVPDSPGRRVKLQTRSGYEGAPQSRIRKKKGKRKSTNITIDSEKKCYYHQISEKYKYIPEKTMTQKRLQEYRITDWQCRGLKEAYNSWRSRIPRLKG